jgi:hypothetical protein
MTFKVKKKTIETSKLHLPKAKKTIEKNLVQQSPLHIKLFHDLSHTNHTKHKQN